MTDAYFTPDAIRARVVPIPGARNLRDMGGYPTRDGRRVRQAMLYRGGHPRSPAASANHAASLLSCENRLVLGREYFDRRDIVLGTRSTGHGFGFSLECCI